MTYSDELELAEIARKHNVLIISDEIYGWLNHHNDHILLLHFIQKEPLLPLGLSKWCGAGGWRFGAGIFPLMPQRI